MGVLQDVRDDALHLLCKATHDFGKSIHQMYTSVMLTSPSQDCGVLQDVRDDALHLLDVLASRIWKDSLKSSKASAPGQAGLPLRRSSDASHGPVAVVIGSLQDSYQQFQYQLSAKLAR